MKILIIDDHALFREGLIHVLDALDEQMCIIEAPDYDRALQHAADNPDLDMVLLDLNLPGKDGFAALAAFAQRYSALPIVILSASRRRSDIQRALDAGAMGYIPKDTTSAIMLNALRLVLSGGIYVPQDITREEDKEADSVERPFGLTTRQQQVLTLIARGHSNKQIAQQMNLAEGTVKMHITAILKTLGLSNRTQAAMAAEKLGLGISTE